MCSLMLAAMQPNARVQPCPRAALQPAQAACVCGQQLAGNRRAHRLNSRVLQLGRGCVRASDVIGITGLRPKGLQLSSMCVAQQEAAFPGLQGGVASWPGRPKPAGARKQPHEPIGTRRKQTHVRNEYITQIN
jgi:hypothetical protein